MFRDVDGVIESANNTEFGLASGVFTTDLDKALDVCEYLFTAFIRYVILCR